MTATMPLTDRVKVRRLGNRGNYDRDTIHAILDEALVCHVGFVVDGSPVVIPTIHWREGDMLYVHGSAASRMLRSLRDGVEACVTVTLVDGLVLARSAFHHSMNYRSVVVFGTARAVEGEEKLRALDALVDHVVRGRSREMRPHKEIELKQTLVLALPLDEASAKIRTGGPVDDEEDYALPVWAGTVDLHLAAGAVEADARLLTGVKRPGYLADLLTAWA